MGSALSTLLVTSVVLISVFLIYQTNLVSDMIIIDAQDESIERFAELNQTRLKVIPVATTTLSTFTSRIFYDNVSGFNRDIWSIDTNVPNISDTEINITGTGSAASPAVKPGNANLIYFEDLPKPNDRILDVGLLGPDGKIPPGAPTTVLDTNLVLLDDHISKMSYSPDGTKIAYDKYNVANSKYDLYVMDADGNNKVNITNRSMHNDTNPTWSPDGTKIAFESEIGGFSDIYYINSDGSGGLCKKTNGFFDGYNNIAPSWSNDGTKIAFSTDRYPITDYDIALLTSDCTVTESPTRITDANDVQTDPDWSPDDTQIVYQYINGWASRDLYTVDIIATTTSSTKITSAKSKFPNNPDWYSLETCGLEFWVENSGSNSFFSFNKMDLYLNFFNATEERIKLNYVKREASVLEKVLPGEWTYELPEFYDDLSLNDIYQQGILNKGEYLRVSLKLPFRAANDRTGMLVFSTDNGTTLTSKFTNNLVRHKNNNEIYMKCGVGP